MSCSIVGETRTAADDGREAAWAGKVVAFDLTWKELQQRIIRIYQQRKTISKWLS